MARYDVVVVGGGVSGAAFAFHASRAGRKVLLVEREGRLGGCLHTVRTPSGYWFELGGHTCYATYSSLIDVLDGCGLRGEIQVRAKPRLRFLDGGRILPGQNATALLRLMDKLELLRSLPRLFSASQAGETVYSYYSRIVGRRNYGKVLGPMLSAVPSQNADAFPAEMLFKRRPRRDGVPRSFTLRNGLQGLAEAAAGTAGTTARTGAEAVRVEAAAGGYAVELAGGERVEASVLALATPPGTAARLLREVAPELAGQVARIKEAQVDTLGFAVKAERVRRVPPSTFLIPLDDAFHSVVTRDVVPDPDWRAFTFHFKPGITSGERLRRAAEVLGISPAEVEAPTERRAVLPSPVLGHREVVGEVDRLLAGTRLAITGNWFAGLALEDCVQRSRDEWARVAQG